MRSLLSDRAVASRIFERGLDFFGKEIDYVLCYLSFLISINDENSKFFYRNYDKMLGNRKIDVLFKSSKKKSITSDGGFGGGRS